MKPWAIQLALYVFTTLPLAACASAEASEDDTESGNDDLTKKGVVEQLAGTRDNQSRAYELVSQPNIELYFARTRIKAPIREALEIPNDRLEGDGFSIYERDLSVSREITNDAHAKVEKNGAPRDAKARLVITVRFAGTPAVLSTSIDSERKEQPFDLLRPTDQGFTLRDASGKLLVFRRKAMAAPFH